MKDNPAEARDLMWQNESYVFFREMTTSDPLLGPIGAQGVPLTPSRSLAIDRKIWAYGTPVWLETTRPIDSTRHEEFRRLLISQDTGSAIIGHARGDVFWGMGIEASETAGHMKTPGRMIVLLPKAVATRVNAER